MPNDGKYIERAPTGSGAEDAMREAFRRDAQEIRRDAEEIHSRQESFRREAAEKFLPPVAMPVYEIPRVETKAFGINAEKIRKSVDALEKFIALPVIPFRFADHHAWSDWKVQMRQKYGKDFANQELKRFEDNKLRANRLGGLATTAEFLIMVLGSGDEDDEDEIRFAHHIENVWGLAEVSAEAVRYRSLPVAEGIKMMPYFDQKALELLQILHDESERRLQHPPVTEEFVDGAAFAAK